MLTYGYVQRRRRTNNGDGGSGDLTRREGLIFHVDVHLLQRIVTRSLRSWRSSVLAVIDDDESRIAAWRRLAMELGHKGKRYR
jgi:hypothetical protein